MACFLTILLILIAPTLKVTAEPVIVRIVPSESVRLRDPSAISVATDGSILITDTGHHRVIAIDSKGNLLSEIGSFGNGPGEFQWPKDVAAESGLAIWITDYGNRRIVKLSRRFEIRSYHSINSDEESRPEQVEQLAVSPQGDLYFYAEDSGKLLKYDPLFVRQGVLGSSTGRDIIPRIRQLVFIPTVGVVWHSRGDDVLYSSDPLLTSMRSFDIGLGDYKNFVFCAKESCMIAAGTRGIFQYCFDGGGLVELIDSAALKDAAIAHIDDLAFITDSFCYVLDSKSGALYSISFDTN